MKTLFGVGFSITIVFACHGRRTQRLIEKQPIAMHTPASIASDSETLLEVDRSGSPAVDGGGMLLNDSRNSLSSLLLVPIWNHRPRVSSSLRQAAPPVHKNQRIRLPRMSTNFNFEGDSLSGKLDQLKFHLRSYMLDRKNGQIPDAAIEALILEIEETTAPVKFNETLIWGDWQLVWQLNTKKAAASQKALSPLPQYSNFMIDETGEKVFRNIVQLSKRRFKVVADVSYDDPASASGNPSNRLTSTIVAAGIQAQIGERFGWKPLRIPLPLKGNGWLDVIYLSEEMRITRGNRGGLFVHLRPHLLKKN